MKGYDMDVVFGDSLTRVGNVMQAVGDFLEAGAVYEEAVSHFPSNESKVTVCRLAADAFLSADRLEWSEINFIQAWKLSQGHSDKLRLHDDPAHFLINGTLSMYFVCYSNGSVAPTMSIAFALAPLLHLSGFSALACEGGNFMKYLKRNCRTRSAAKTIFFEALRTPTLEEFRNRLLCCLKSHCHEVVDLPVPVSPTKQERIARARLNLPKNGPLAVAHRCAMCDKEE
jgi:hypothetical protein